MKPTLRLSLFCILLITTTLLSCKKETPLPDMAEIQSFTVVIGQDEQRQIVEGVIDGKNITLVVPSAESTTILTPSIETTPGSRVSPASGKPINFASPQIYSVQKGETVQVYTVTAIFEPKPPVAKNTYKFFFLEVTKDCLFAAYDILTDTKSSIYISDPRGTFNPRFLPRNVLSYDKTSHKGGKSYEDSPLYYKMKEIAEHDPNAEFILYSSSDFYYQFFLDNDSDPTPINGCIAQEIGWDKCRYVYLEDGTANYAPMYTISDQKMKEHITYFGPLRDVFGYRNLTEQEDSDIRYKALYGYALSFGPIGRSECWLSLPEAVNYLKSTTFEPAYFTKMVKKDPFKQYYDLTPEQRERFAKMLKFDVREFNSGNNKPNFIITGSNFAGNQSSQDKMMRMVKSLCAQFGVEYNMYFKGHPANTMFESMLQAEIVNGLNIKSLPQSIPAEVFIAAGYANMLAGYYSSLYFGVDHTKIYKMFVSGGYDGMAEYIREMLVPAGGYPGKDKWADFNNF